MKFNNVLVSSFKALAATTLVLSAVFIGSSTDVNAGYVCGWAGITTDADTPILNEGTSANFNLFQIIDSQVTPTLTFSNLEYASTGTEVGSVTLASDFTTSGNFTFSYPAVLTSDIVLDYSFDLAYDSGSSATCALKIVVKDVANTTTTPARGIGRVRSSKRTMAPTRYRMLRRVAN